MAPRLLKALLISIPVLGLLAWCIIRGRQRPGASLLLVLLGGVFLLIVVFAHVCEALGLLPAMGWGRPDSPGHYLDFASATLGSTLIVAWVALRLRASRRRTEVGSR